MQEITINETTTIWRSGSELVLTQDQDKNTVSVFLGVGDFEKVMLAANALITSNVTKKE
jgi:hypothetical protein